LRGWCGGRSRGSPGPGGDRLAAELDAELGAYFESAVDQHLRSGLSREEAIRAARRELGNTGRREGSRARRGLGIRRRERLARRALGAALVMMVMGIVAALIPSRRALNVDPLAALRVE